MLNLKHRNGKSNTRNLFILGTAVLIGVALMPYGVVAEQFPAFGHFVDHAFSTNLSHVIGHFGIFVAMGTAVLLLFPKLQKHPKGYFILMATLGFLQEFLQITTFKHRPLAVDEVQDFLVDMIAATITYLVITRFFSNKSSSA